MKCVIFFIVVTAVLFLESETTSPMNCNEHECDKSMCPSVENCQCGTHFDQCACCSYCNKCPGQECSIIKLDQCTEGYECKHPKEETGPDIFNKPGICMKITKN